MKNIFKLLFIIFIFTCALYLLGDKTVSNKNEKTENNIFKSIPTYKEENNERYIKFNNKNKDLTIDEVVKSVNINLDINFYENIEESPNKNTNLILVNKHYALDKDYIPNDLVQVDYKYTSGITVYANKEAKEKFEELSTDASAVGLNIKAISAYRSYEYQKKLYEEYLLNDPKEIVDTYSARAGHSEHQTGLAFDVYNVSSPYTSFGETKEYEWVKINAHKYGFIIRYTSSNQHITGYKNEPWHLRYVGVVAAKHIYENDITLEEYVLNNKNS